MTATDELRRLLDERGVEWEELQSHEGGKMTRWRDSTGRFVTAYDEGMVTFFDDFYWQPTPQQAIEATLGVTDAMPTQAESSGTCHDVWDTELTGRLRFQCSECGAVSLEITPRFCPACGRKVVEPTKNDVDVEVAQ